MKCALERIGEDIGALARRFQSAIEWRVYRPIHLRYAEARRSRLGGVTFVGITGSAGKTSAKSMIASVLESAGSVKQTAGTANRLFSIAEVVAATKPSDSFCVLELSAERPGYFDRLLPLVRPRIAVVTAVGDDQLKAFGAREAIAAEKGKLVTALPAEGIAVLNADDPLVRAMANGCQGRVITYGASEIADLRVREVHAAWPERLSFTVRFRDHDYPVRTQLCGKHWVTSTLAALATGVAAGVPLETAVQRVAAVPPGRARMEPVSTPDGITFIRDDWKGAFWSMPTVFDFLREAKAERKIVVIGTLADYHGTVRSRYRIIGEEALKVADIIIFVGRMATFGLRAQRFIAKEQSLLAFTDTREASAALQRLLRAGDLVVLKGAVRADHLGRLYHARTGPVACWRMDCGKDMLCDACPKLRGRSVERLPAQGDDSIDVTGRAEVTPRTGTALQVFVGIGNPGEKYRNTPHNIGFSVLDLVAERNGLTWKDLEHAQVAQSENRWGTLLLVKPQSQVNNTGKSLLALSRVLGFNAADCILVQDDIHLPAGKVRVRMRGGDGGHLGVRSTLVAFQTSDIRRIKVGVAVEAGQTPTIEYLVSPLPLRISSKVNEGCATAADQLMRLLKERRAD